MGGLHAVGLGRHPPPQSDTMGYSERAGGTHPTGMHFVLDKNIFRKMYVQ